MRVFLAVFPPAEAQEYAFALAERVREAQGAAASVSWVKRENLHYTLKFLGELGEDGARRAADGAREAASASVAFDARLGAPGAFPNARHARVLWLGLDQGAGEFVHLAERADSALARRGFDREKRAFNPHLTLARVREPKHDWTSAIAAACPAGDQPAARFRIDRVLVMKSTLSTKGSIYEVIGEAALAGGSPAGA